MLHSRVVDLNHVLSLLERYFEFQKLGTNWKTEILGGFTTFITMAYIVFVNPSILRDAGMPVAAVVVATCLSAAFGSILMGVLARYPIALAPGMGLNAYFTYTVVLGMGVSWQTALGAVFLSGVAFLVLTLIGARRWVVAAIPVDLYAAVSAGIGLFIAFIGLRNAGIVRDDPATLVSLGDLSNPTAAVALFGVVTIAVLRSWNVRAAILLGVLASMGLSAFAGLVEWHPQSQTWSDLSGTMFQLDIRGALAFGLLDIVFVFFFVDLFDNIGTLVAISKRAGLLDRDNKIPRLDRILLTDSTATIAGSLAGTTTVVSYIESAAGVAAGARTGVASIVTGLLFLVSLAVVPVVTAIPSAATAPALIIVGGLMLSSLAEVKWEDECVAAPVFLTLITIPLTFSIANGLAFGITSYVLMRLARGQYRQVHWASYPLAALLLFRFFYMSGGH